MGIDVVEDLLGTSVPNETLMMPDCTSVPNETLMMPDWPFVPGRWRP